MLDSNSVDFDSENEDSESENCVRVVNDVEINNCQSTSIVTPLYALILAPTRELAVQIKHHLTEAAKYTDIKVRKTTPPPSPPV